MGILIGIDEAMLMIIDRGPIQQNYAEIDNGNESAVTHQSIVTQKHSDPTKA